MIDRFLITPTIDRETLTPWERAVWTHGYEVGAHDYSKGVQDEKRSVYLEGFHDGQKVGKDEGYQKCKLEHEL